MAKRVLHPKMVTHAAAVKSAHAHLVATKPGFAKLKPADRFKHVQAHVRKTGGL